MKEYIVKGRLDNKTGFMSFTVKQELIRCKDCKHRDPEDKKCDSGHFIQWNLPRSDEWFCADAEHRGEE